jgi:hypothetical protein
MNTNLEANASQELTVDDSLPATTSIVASSDVSMTLRELPPEIERQVQDLIKSTKVGETQGLAVLEKFAVGFEPFLRLKAEAESIVVTDASQTHLIARAKEIDKELIEADKMLTEIHKEQKEFYLRPGQMVDGCRRIPSNAIAKVRTHLQQQFDYVRNIERARIDAIAQARRAQLEEYGNTGGIVGLGTMDDEQFGLILAGAKAKFEEDQQSAENARIENERLRRENERLAAENAAKRATEERRISRVNRLSAIGMTFDGSGYVYQELTFSNSALNDESDDVFAAEFDAIAPVISERQAAIQEQARVDAENARIAQEQLNKLNAERAEKERKEREMLLSPEKDQIAVFGSKLMMVAEAAPELTQPEAQAILLKGKIAVAKAVEEMCRAAGNLVAVPPARSSDEPCPF